MHNPAAGRAAWAESAPSGEIVEAFITEIPGAVKLYNWFGHWPAFHDAEIVSLTLNREGPSLLRVHTWHQTNRVNVQGQFVIEKPCIVSFLMEEIHELKLAGFSPQNVISELLLRQAESGIEIAMGDCFGLAGSITAARLTIQFEPAALPVQ